MVLGGRLEMGSYFWVVDFSQKKDGRLAPIIIGGRAFTSNSRAQRYIDDSNLSQRAEIVELETSNQARATQAIKAKLITKYRDLDKGMTRAIHNVEE